MFITVALQIVSAETTLNSASKIIQNRIGIFWAIGNLRYHGKWPFTKNAKMVLFAVQIENTETNIFAKRIGIKNFFTFEDEKNYF